MNKEGRNQRTKPYVCIDELILKNIDINRLGNESSQSLDKSSLFDISIIKANIENIKYGINSRFASLIISVDLRNL
ncbi:hypothetical protein O185_23770 [Photorhabdus temperata J3]|uniref:Uncharacterized protein n=1 Tax=Photorhabdus temperata J3 TaxID=1389415 RepID=U7QRM5_PHOTE|nr:hypothetical protein [Photorhabdus temperata]ERT10629.1 hypothetical protein O185_23770 [Photorhabdus temperata J3]